MGRKTLFIFYYYGEGYAAGIQNSRLINGLESYHLNYEIIYRYSKDNNIPRAKQVSVPKYEGLNKIINIIFPGIIPIVRLDEILWTIVVILKIRRRYREFSSIHITSSPFFVQLIGNYFRTRRKIKWIVQLLDPVSDNYYINTPQTSKYILNKLEKKVIKRADLVITNNQRLDAIIKNRYYDEKDKLVIIPPVTDDSIVEAETRNEKLTIVHSGTIYGLRTLDYLINSLKIYNTKYKNTDAFEIELIGNCSQKEMDKVRKNNLDNQIKIIEHLEKRELYLRFGKADGFLVIDALNHEGIFFPTKLCEYFSQKRIILAITAKESVTADLIREARHLYFTNGEEEKFADSLFNLIKDRNYYNHFDRDYFRKYLQISVAKKYLNTIGNIELNNRNNN